MIEEHLKYKGCGKRGKGFPLTFLRQNRNPTNDSNARAQTIDQVLLRKTNTTYNDRHLENYLEELRFEVFLTVLDQELSFQDNI